MLKEIMGKNFSNSLSNIELQIHEAERIQNVDIQNNTKNQSDKNIIIKLLKTNGKENIWKQLEEMYRYTPEILQGLFQATTIMQIW